MASRTKHLKVRRALRKRSAGSARKAVIRSKGTTANNLPLDKPNANELAQKQKSVQK